MLAENEPYHGPCVRTQSYPVAYQHSLLELDDVVQASHIPLASNQPLGTPGCLPQNFHDCRAVVGRPGEHLRVNGLTKVEEQEGYRLFKPHGHVDRSLYFR